MLFLYRVATFYGGFARLRKPEKTYDRVLESLMGAIRNMNWTPFMPTVRNLGSKMIVLPVHG